MRLVYANGSSSWLIYTIVVSAGIVPSAVMTTLMQVFSRIFVTWVIVEGVPGVSHIAL